MKHYEYTASGQMEPDQSTAPPATPAEMAQALADRAPLMTEPDDE